LAKLLKVAGVLGLAAPIFVIACILAAAALMETFSWMHNALSDLGVQFGFTEVLFNSSLIIAGFLYFIFAVGLWVFLGKSILGKVGVCLFLVACAALVGIGVFNESFRPTHYVVSVMLFVFLPLSLLAFVGTFWFACKRALSVFTLVLGVIAALMWVVQFSLHPFMGVAIPEFVSGMAGATWTMVMGYLMLKEPEKVS
jgi:hypothetical membrane protein